jgi:outer membrane protein assembly factor BamB
VKTHSIPNPWGSPETIGINQNHWRPLLNPSNPGISGIKNQYGGFLVKRNRIIGREIKTKLIKSVQKMIVIGLFVLIPVLSMTTVGADGGMIPYNEFEVYEPGQKAIIAWDGEQEIMILSVDVYSEESTKALHMVPFPSLPDVELGSIESFDKINEIINRGRQHDYGEYKDGNMTLAPNAESNVEIVFTEKIGPHDITAVQVNSPNEFTEWVNNFLKDKGISNKKMPDKLDNVIGHYTDQNIRYFVFDVVELEKNTRSVDPIVYKFRSKYLFFPLEISSIIEGHTEITLAMLMPPNLPVNKNSIRELGFDETFKTRIDTDDIKDISEEFEPLFVVEASLSVYRGHFSLVDLEDDVIIKRLTNVNWMHTEDENFKAFRVEDFDGDGKSEIALSTYDKLSVFNSSSGRVAHKCKLNNMLPSSYPWGLYITDINSDNIPDIINHRRELKIRAIDGKDSTTIWEFDLKSIEGYDVYRIWNTKISDGYNSNNIFVNIGVSIFALDLKTGEIEWEYEVDEDPDGCGEIVVDDFNLDSKLEILLKFSDSPDFLLNAETGEKLNLLTQLSIDQRLINYGDLTSDPGIELVYLKNDELYVVDITTGQNIWTTHNSDLDLGRIYNVHIIDYNQDNKLDVITFTTKGIQILNGETGELLDKFDLNFDNKDYKLNYLTNTEYRNIDDDVYLELISIVGRDLNIFDLKTGDIDWKFSTGDPIMFYEIKDIDSDDNEEVIVVTSNKVYSVEHSVERSDSRDDFWNDQQIVFISSIILPLIIIVIIAVITFRYWGHHRKEK